MEIPEGYCQCGCGETVNKGKKFRQGHYAKLHPPKWNGGKQILPDRVLIYKPGHPRGGNKGYVKESILIVEGVLNKPLPTKAVIHHSDGNPHNNSKENLVVCENQAYHRFIHRRMAAYKATGNAGWRICKFCHKYDAPENLSIYRRGKNKDQVSHMKCQVEANKNYRRRKNANTQGDGNPDTIDYISP